METLQLQQEYADQRKGEQARALNLHHHEVLNQQERLTNKWKRELEKSVAAYEALLQKMKTENDAINRENNHWRGQMQQAQMMKSTRIQAMLQEKAKQIGDEEEASSKEVQYSV